MTAATDPAPPADLDAGLRRLKLAAVRRLAPELLVTARTQRWAPEELLRTLIDAELAARDASNTRARMKTAAFPVVKTIEEFDVAASSIPQATFDYLASLEWVRAAENYCAVGPAGTGKSHSLIALGVAAVHAGHKVRYFTAADLVGGLGVVTVLVVEGAVTGVWAGQAAVGGGGWRVSKTVRQAGARGQCAGRCKVR